MKAGGAEVRVLTTPTPNLGDENWRGKIIDAARRVAGFDEEGSALVGYVVIGLFSDGTSSLGYRWDKDRTPIPRTLMPTYIAEVIRRDLITAVEADEVACHVVNRANGWED